MGLGAGTVAQRHRTSLAYMRSWAQLSESPLKVIRVSWLPGTCDLTPMQETHSALPLLALVMWYLHKPLHFYNVDFFFSRLWCSGSQLVGLDCVGKPLSIDR